MKVLTIYAHHNPRSLCHAVLERFDAGLRDAGHSNEIVDLHAIGFDPVLRDADGPNWIDDYALHYPGVQQVQHEYFYAVHGADRATIESYLARAYALGTEFGV